MAGSAIGLGNIWRFPYMVGENGGAAFILVYLICTLLLSLPIFLSESIIGRKTHRATYGALARLAPGTKWKHMSLLTILGALLIMFFYSVVGGWSVEYFIKSFTFATKDPALAEGFFQDFIVKPWSPLLFHTVFLLLTAVIVGFGVKKGIEKFSSVSMPLLFLLIVAILIYSLTLPGADAGVRYLVQPDLSKIDVGVVISAMGQSFFSLSLGVGTILTYSSYMSDKDNLMSVAVGTIFFDIMFAVLAGFAIMPAVFSAGIPAESGPGLVFKTIPYIFASMGESAPVISTIVSVLFFLTILVAALTSSISMFETSVAFLVEQRHLSRWGAVAVIFAIIWSGGCLCSLSFGPLSDIKLFGDTIFEFCDHLTANYIMIFGGLMFTIFVGWKLKKEEVREQLGATHTFGLFYFLIRYVAPVFIVIIFITNLFL